MPALSRNCAKLLHRVSNQTHATQEDHHNHQQQQLEEHEKQEKENGVSPRRNIPRQTKKRQQEEQQPTPPSSNRRSSLQRSGTKRMKFTEETSTISGGRKRKKDVEKGSEEAEDHMREPESESSSADEMDQQQSHAKPSAGRKGRKVDSTASRLQTDEDDGVPSWLTQPKPGRKFQTATSAKSFENLHAPPVKFRKPTTTYSKKIQPERPRLKAAKQRPPLVEEDPPKREFSKARIYERSTTDDSKDARVLTQPRTTRSMDENCSMSPPSSSLSSLDSDAIQHTDPGQNDTEDALVECSICGDTVDILLRQNFEDEFIPGRAMTYKWQQRFCQYHKQDRAKSLWQERRYPDIDWDGLESRLRLYHAHLRDVTTGRKESRHRTKLKDMVKSGKKTTLQNFGASDGQRQSSVGYYGPRGEKAMTEHILAHLSDDIRLQAAKDKLVAASGVSGGVSGFVQLVLVPELAEQLIQEDLGLSRDQIIEVLDASAELGELLHPELNEQLDEAASQGV